MPIHLILLVLSIVLFALAGLLDWPSSTPKPYGHPLGWFAGAALAAAFLVPA